MFIRIDKMTFKQIVSWCGRMYRNGYPADYVNGMYMMWECYANNQTNSNPT